MRLRLRKKRQSRRWNVADYRRVQVAKSRLRCGRANSQVGPLSALGLKRQPQWTSGRELEQALCSTRHETLLREYSASSCCDVQVPDNVARPLPGAAHAIGDSAAAGSVSCSSKAISGTRISSSSPKTVLWSSVILAVSRVDALHDQSCWHIPNTQWLCPEKRAV